MAGSIALALAGAFLWGVASILLSPCHLASIPLVVGYVVRQNNADARKGILLSVVFSLGVFAVLALMGGVTAASGRMMGDIGKPLSVVLAVLFIIVGLFITGLFPFLDFGRSMSSVRVTAGYRGSFTLGVIFGAGLGPCAFAFMVPVLSVAFAQGASNPAFSAGLVLMYALGHCLLIALAGVSAGAVGRILSYNEKSATLKYLRIISGLLVAAAGVYLIIKTV